MNLAKYQKELVNQLYTKLMTEKENYGITLFGGIGSGKTTIVKNLINQLLEGWSIFYIEGINPELNPYSTWSIGTKIQSKRKLGFDGEILFGINFLPLPISLDFGSSFQYKDQSFILTPSEKSLILGIKSQAGASRNILFIADNYELWDIPSKQFLQKIMLSKLNLLPGYHLVTLLVTREKTTMEINSKWDCIPIPEISDDNLLFILRQKGYADMININNIRLCAGNDISLALMAAKYYDNNNIELSDFTRLLDNRCQNLPLETQEACKILEPLSVIDSCFTKDETAYFMNPAPLDKIETEYQAEEYLAIAEEEMFISGSESYHFMNDRIKLYFRNRISRKVKLYHRKFAEYLQKRHPEDYFNRGKHLKLSLQTNDPKIILNAWQLLFLSYIRRSFEVGDKSDVYNIHSYIESLLNRLDSELAEKQRHVWNELCAGFQEFSNFHYKQAIYHLQAINESQLVLASLVEVKRTILLCHVQIAESRSIIKQYATSLFNLICECDFCEDEQYCLSALLLLDVYIDKSNDEAKVEVLHKNFIKIIAQHPNQPVFQEFEARYNRKSSLHYSALIASRQTYQSINFYRKYHNYSALYMALCNHAGNLIISGEYDEAEQALSECMVMLNNNNGVYYPSSYKVENNRILLTYLQDEKKAGGNNNDLIKITRKAATDFGKIINRQEDEVSYVVLLNYLSLLMLSNMDGWEEQLEKAVHQLVEIDEYYQYYLHDLLFSSALIRGDENLARKELSFLNKIEVPLLEFYKLIFHKRRLKQEELLNDSKVVKGNPLAYHDMIKNACSHVQDPSCQFYGRGFLLSDLQFLSF